MPAKVKVFLVQSAQAVSANRLIRGTLKEVEQKLRGEVSIEPCTPEFAHENSDIEIEEASA